MTTQHNTTPHSQKKCWLPYLMLIAGLIALTANTVRMTASVIEYKKAAEHNARTAFYLHECWDASTQTNLSTDICVELEKKEPVLKTFKDWDRFGSRTAGTFMFRLPVNKWVYIHDDIY